MLRREIMQPYTTKDYSARDFKKELKVFFEHAAVQNKQIILYLEDQNLV